LKAENELLKGVVLGGQALKGKAEAKTPKLSTATIEFEKAKYAGMTKRTKQKYVTAFKVLNEFLGNERLSDINHFKMNKFFMELKRLPPKRGGKFKDMTFKQMIAANDGEGIHKQSFDGYKSPIKLFIEWCNQTYESSFDGVNVAEIKYTGARVGTEDGQRSFKADELEELFKCKEMKEYCKSGKYVYKFWLPAIGLFSGMRVNEICQLNPFTDIVKEGDAWYFKIDAKTEAANDIVKSVKSGTARDVPIHSRLVELGLLDYIEALKKAGYKRMFPLDKPKGKVASGNTARNFRRYIEDIGLRDETKNKKVLGMHAFRKTIITQAYKGGFLKDLLCIVGHESGSRDETGGMIPDVTKLYIDDEAFDVPLVKKKETIEKVKFDIEFYKPVNPVFK